ncbi:MAG: DNA cytosine methyltransferase [Bacillota bacterium]
MKHLHLFRVGHIFCGSGGGAIGFEQVKQEYRGIAGRFVTVAGIDSDPEACQDFDSLTYGQAHKMDLFSYNDYTLFHGKQPPKGFKEVMPEDIFEVFEGKAPDTIFTSPPCKGFSGLLPKAAASSEKYQALNRLTIRGIALVLEAFKYDPVGIILFENVPLITSRGSALLTEIKLLLQKYGYLYTESTHCCGEIGGLGQRRKRYLLIARHPVKVSSFVYEPEKRPLKTIGDIIGPLPMPDDPAGGPMHRLPRLDMITWIRLALIPAGGDWRDLQRIASEEYRLAYIPRGGGSYGVQKWDDVSDTVIGRAGVRGSNSAAIADPRMGYLLNHSPREGVYRIMRFEEPSTTVTGSAKVGRSNGASCIADPRLPNQSTKRFSNNVQAGAPSVADPRLGCCCRNGSYGVQDYDAPTKTVTGADIHSGSAAVADKRLPDMSSRPDPPPIIIAPDGTWHRPLTTYELAMLQGLPTHMRDGSPLQLAGKSDARWRERIGNMVPPPAAKAIAEVDLKAKLMSIFNAWELSHSKIWVVPFSIRPDGKIERRV